MNGEAAMMQEQYLLALLSGAAATVVMLVYLIGRGVTGRRGDRWKERLTPLEIESLDEALPLPPPKGWRERFDRDFINVVNGAGLEIGVEQVIALILLCGVGGCAGLYLWRGEPWLAMVGFVLGLMIPVGWLMLVAGRRRRQMQEQMPDAIFLLARSLRAGLGLDHGFHLMARESATPLSEELVRVSDQVKLGLSVPAALQGSAQRVGLVDFSVFAAIIALHRNTGGQLPMLLDRLAGGVRDRVQFRGHFRAATAMGRISAIALGASVPLIFLWYVLFQPETVQIFIDTPGGIGMLVTAFSLEIVGVLWLYRLLKSDD
jgi:tight adherence protein B